MNNVSSMTSLPMPDRQDGYSVLSTQYSVLSEATGDAILALREKYPEVQSAILDALRLAQDEIGYLPVEATNEVAALLGLSPHHVRSLASFYTMFFTEPVGTHIVEVCDNLSCAL